MTGVQREFAGAGRRSRRFLIGSILLVLALAMTGSGVAWSYDRAHDQRLTPGTVIAGVPVGGLTVAEAVEEVRERVEEPLHRSVTLTAAGVQVATTPWELGLRADVESEVLGVLDDQRSQNVLVRTWRRVVAGGSGVSLEPELDRELVRAAVEGFAEQADRPPVDAEMTVEDGWVEARRARDGFRVDREAAVDAVAAGLAADHDDLEVPGAVVRPEVPDEALGKVILIHTGSNRLYLYEGGEIVRDHPVASGKRGYSTPTGDFHVTLKRRHPSWGNPGSAWARSMPQYIGPGPNNPLGTRAMNINARGIRIHGTADRGSIGRHASHGCVRMFREHVEELFELVDVGTPVIIRRL